MLRRAFIFQLFTLAAFGQSSSRRVPSPYEVKAAFLYNFLKFVDWPSTRFVDPKSPYVVGVLGRDPFGVVLDTTMLGKSVNGRSVVVRRVSDADVSKCHLLFISSSEQKRLGQVFGGLRGAPILTVGETADFAEVGGMVGFFIEQNKVRFAINLRAAKEAGLHMDPTLLSLARTVDGG